MRRALVALSLAAAALWIVPETSAAPTVSIGDVAVPEGAAGTTAAAVIPVTFSTPTTTVIQLAVTSNGGTATPNLDYRAVANHRTRVARGSTSAEIRIPIHGDSFSEDTETFDLQIVHAGSATVVDGVATVTIVNDDGPAGITVTEPVVMEADAPDTSRLRFVFELSHPLESNLEIDFETSPGTANGNDFQDHDGTMRLRRGTTRASIPVLVRSDNRIELAETVVLTITDIRVGPGRPVPTVTPTGLTFVGTILDDDAPPEGDRALFIHDPIESLDAMRVVEVVQAASVDHVILAAWSITPENSPLYSAVIDELHQVGVTVDALGGQDEWGTVEGANGVVPFLNGLTWFHSVSPFDFDGIHLDVRPWRIPGLTPDQISAGLGSFMGFVDANAPGMNVELDVDSWVNDMFPTFVGALAGLGVDDISVFTYRDLATGPNGINAMTVDEVTAANGIGIGVRPTGSLSDFGPEFDQDTFFEESLDWLRVEGLKVDAAFGDDLSYLGFAMQGFHELEGKLVEAGIIEPFVHEEPGPDGALFVRTGGDITTLDVPTLISFVIQLGAADLLVDAEDVGSSPAADAAFANLITAAHGAGRNVFAVGRDFSWVAAPAGATDWVADVVTYNGAPGDDFDGVHLAVDAWASVDPPADIHADFVALATAVAGAVPEALTYDVSIPPHVDGGTVDVPDTASAVLSVADGITIEPRADTGAAIVAATQTEATAANTAGKGFRVTISLLPLPDLSTTFSDETFPEITLELDTVELHYGPYEQWKGVAGDDYANAHFKVFGFFPPLAGGPPPGDTEPPFIMFASSSIQLLDGSPYDGTIVINGPADGVACPNDLGYEWCIVAAGSSPPQAVFVASATDNVDSAPSVECVPASPFAMPPNLATTGQCTSTDAAGNTGAFDYYLRWDAPVLE